MKKLLLAVSLLSPLLGFSQQKTSKTYDLLLGGYTRTNENKGITVYHFDTETGKITYLNGIDGVENPDFLAISADRKFVYSCNVDTKGGEGHASAFKFDYVTGKLELINTQPAGGTNPVHIVVDKDRKNVFISHYSSGSLTVLPINKDGSLGPVSQKIQDEGGIGNKGRQPGPHVHSAILSTDGKNLLVADLGTDKINIYNYNSNKTPALTPADPAFESAAAGDGPRHMEFSPDKKYLYLITEIAATVRVYRYNKGGKLTFLQSINMMPETFTKNGAADIHVSPDGAFLYASNRGAANNIVLYAIDKQTGRLTYIERYDVSKAPRGFTIDPTGNFLLSAGQDGNTVIVFKIDKATGKLTLTDNKLDIGQVVCLKWVSIE